MTLDSNQLTIVGVLTAIGLAGLKRLWVFGWTYTEKDKDLTEMTEDRNFWRDTALQSMGHVDTALGKMK